MSNSKRYPKWHKALTERITELYANKKMFCELMKYVWAEPLDVSVYSDTDVAFTEKERITVYDIVEFIIGRTEFNMWCGDVKKSEECFLKLKEYIGVPDMKE